MTDKENIEDQDVELQETDEEISEMKHDPKNAEAQSIASVDKAADAGTASAPLPGSNSPGATAKSNNKKDPMPKLTKAGMINAMFNKMKKVKKNNLETMYNSVMKDHVENEEEDAIVEDNPSIDYKADFKDDLKALVAEEGVVRREAAPRLLGKDGVLEDREIHQHIADLEGAANATRNPLWHVEAVHHLTAEFDNAGVGRFRSVDLADQCRFAGTVRADQRVNFAMCDIK